MKDIIDELFSCHELVIKKEGFQVSLTLKNTETKKEWTSVLPDDHHLDVENVQECVKFMRGKTQ